MAKPGDQVRPADRIEVIAPEPYVSRGGKKLAHALACFQLKVSGQTAIDVGASTGGFTDCLLQHGCASVFAVDVGQGQLAWKLRRDPRVTVMDKVNARHLTRAHFPPDFAGADIVSIDCSFISLKKILPVLVAFARPGGKIAALVKPQFEAGKAEADRGRGVIRDARIHQAILADLEDFAVKQLGLAWRGMTESPLLGPAGNKEFLILLEKLA